MKFRRLEIIRLPGIDEPYTLERLGDGVHIVVGPNAIGKSSICRATRSLLWPDDPGQSISARALVDLDGASWSVQRDGARHVWQRDGVDCAPPALPGSHLQDCFLLDVRDLMDSGSDSGRALAEQIRLQMAGGYSLDDARESAFEKVGRGFASRERKEVDAASGRIRKAQLQQETLADREATLKGLEEMIQLGESAQARLVHFATALEVLGLRGKREGVEADLAAMPRACANLVGKEIEWLDAKQVELDDAEKAAAEIEAGLGQALDDIRDSRLAEPLDKVEISSWRKRADSLGRLADRREAADAELQAARKKLGEASRVIGGATDPVPKLEREDHHQLYSFLRDATRAEQGRAALEQRIKLLAGHAFSADQKKQQQLQERAASSLRDWMRAPDPGASDARIAGLARGTATALGLAVAAIGLVLGFMFHPALHALAGAGLVLVASAWLLARDRDLGVARQAAVRSFPQGAGAPSSWNAGEVAERLREIELEVADGRAAEMRARDRDVERQGLASELETAQNREQGVRDRGEVLAASLGLERASEAAELVDTATALIALREAHEAVAAAEGQFQKLADSYEVDRAELGRWLVEMGEDDPRDAEASKASVENVQERNRLLVGGRKAEERTGESLDSAREAVQRTREAIEKIFEDAGLEHGDRAGLTRLLGMLERYQELSGEAAGLETSVGLANEKLARAGEDGLATRDESQLRREVEKLEGEAAASNEARNEVAEIRAEIKQASEAHTLENLIAREAEALAALGEKRDRGLEAIAGNFLLDEVKTEHETNQLPAVLKRARDLFALFTNQEYELGVAAEGGGEFVAVESRTGIGKRLHQLSGGECAQLLLSARIAFADEAEGASRLPLFLDEALDQSDPARFDVIARSLGRISEQNGRQIFYLTNDPVDVARMMEALQDEGCASPTVIDLGQLRRGVASIPSADALRVEPRPGIPDPAGMTSEEFGARLQVPYFDPRLRHLGQHLLYVLWDDLPLLKRLAENRIETVGQWLLLSRSDAPLAASLKAGAVAARQLDSRSRLLEIFCEVWSEGRGQPVDREAIESSGSISSRYLEDVADIARELSGDGRRLVDVLSERTDPRLGGFRTKAAGNLETYLEDEGYLDPRPVLGERDVVARALASPAAGDLPEQVCSQLLHLWWQLRVGKPKVTNQAVGE